MTSSQMLNAGAVSKGGLAGSSRSSTRQGIACRFGTQAFKAVAGELRWYLCAGSARTLIAHLPEIVLAAKREHALGRQHSQPASSASTALAVDAGNLPFSCKVDRLHSICPFVHGRLNQSEPGAGVCDDVIMCKGLH